MKTAVGYVRSTDLNEIEFQTSQIKEWAVKNNVELVKIFIDYMPLRIARPQYMLMMQPIILGDLKVDYILAYNIERLTREPSEFVPLTYELRRIGVRIILTNTGNEYNPLSVFESFKCAINSGIRKRLRA